MPLDPSRISRENDSTKNDETSCSQMRVFGEGDLSRFHKHDWLYYHDDDCKGSATLEGKDRTLTSYCDVCGLIVASTLSAVGANRTKIGRKNAWR